MFRVLAWEGEADVPPPGTGCSARAPTGARGEIEMSRLTRPAVPRARQGGFSFIEILVVMGIISVLVGGVIVAIGMWAEKGPEFATKNTLTKVKALIENWQTTYEMYPPSDVTRIADVAGIGKKPKPPNNKVNGAIEAIFQALGWPGFKGDPQWQENELANTDEDELAEAVNKHGTKPLLEIVDGYGNPLVYFHSQDYAKYANGGGPTYRAFAPDGSEMDVEPKPYRNESDGSFRNPDSFQIWSMGPDGEPNTDDDITTWN